MGLVSESEVGLDIEQHFRRALITSWHPPAGIEMPEARPIPIHTVAAASSVLVA